MDNFEITKTEEGKIVDFLTSQELESTPEEYVRQTFLRILHFEYGYPLITLQNEKKGYCSTSKA